MTGPIAKQNMTAGAAKVFMWEENPASPRVAGEEGLEPPAPGFGDLGLRFSRAARSNSQAAPIGSNGGGTRGAVAGLGGSGGGGLAARLGGEGLHERLGVAERTCRMLKPCFRAGDDRSQAGENLGAFRRRAGDFHPDRHHPQVLFGQIVGEGDVEIGEKP